MQLLFGAHSASESRPRALLDYSTLQLYSRAKMLRYPDALGSRYHTADGIHAALQTIADRSNGSLSVGRLPGEASQVEGGDDDSL